MKPLNEVHTDHTNHSVISKKQTNKKRFSTQAIKKKGFTDKFVPLEAEKVVKRFDRN